MKQINNNDQSLLIIFTNYYPYFKGEEYLENEIIYLSRYYSEILILANMADSNHKQTRSLPDNVRSFKSNMSHSTLSRLFFTLKNLRPAYKNYKSNFRKNESKNILHKIYAIYFEARFLAVYDYLSPILDKIDFSKYNHKTIYSYWLYMTARLAIATREDYSELKDSFMFSRAHRYDIDEAATPLKYLPYRPFLLSRLDQIYPVTNKQVDVLTQKFPEYKNKIKRRPLGTILPLSDSGNISGKSNCNAYPLIVSCSATRKIKRIDLIIKSLSHLHNELGTPFHWIHFGAGQDLPKYMNLASKLLPSGSYEFKGHIPNNELHKWYSRHRTSCFINLSSSEGVPVSIMEACSYGIPVIATDVGGTSDIVHDGQNGYLLKSNPTINEVSQALQGLLSLNIKDSQNMRLQATSIWRNNFNAEIVYDEFAQEILNSRVRR